MTVVLTRPPVEREDAGPGSGRPPKPPRPPRRAPRPAVVRPPLTTRQTAARMGLALLAALLIGFVGYLTVFSRLTHVIAQDRLNQTYRAELADGTAPVSEGTFDGVLLADGAPVAQLRIPQIGLDETVVEGTTSGTLTAGPGHRRDTMLPGQSGVSVIMGRAGAFGGPFARIQELQPGQTFTVVTGQGEQRFQVVGVRYAGDPGPASVAGQSRLVLETARGAPFLPTGVVRVDARLVSTVQPPGARATTHATLPAAAAELGTDASHLWALVFALQALLLVEVGAVWTFRRIGARQAWFVFLPVTLLTVLVVCDQVTRLLPNLL